jgi:hypothetical protein
VGLLFELSLNRVGIRTIQGTYPQSDATLLSNDNDIIIAGEK